MQEDATDPRLQAYLQSTLTAGEEVALVVYPQWVWLTGSNIFCWLFALIWLGIVSQVGLPPVCRSLGMVYMLLPVYLPMWGFGIGLALWPHWQRKRLLRTAYVVTNRRILILYPSAVFLRYKMRQWRLCRKRIKAVEHHADGCGDIVLEYRKQRTEKGSSLVAQGLLSVPEVDRVANLIRKQIKLHVAEDDVDRAGIREADAPVLPFCLFLILAGLVFLGVGATQMLEYRLLAAKGVRTTAEVVNIETHSDEDNNTYHCPVVRFKTAAGQEYTLTSDDDAEGVQIGHTVQVCYLAEQPREFMLPQYQYRSSSAWTTMVFGGLLTAFVTLFCCVWYSLKKKEEKNHG